MAQVLKEHTFHQWYRKSKYPWDEWLDGRIWKLERGKDFTCRPENFRTLLYHRARKDGLRVQSDIDRNAGSRPEFIVIQAVKGKRRRARK